jgi:hypothetical protein
MKLTGRPALRAALTASAVFMALYLCTGFVIFVHGGWRSLIWPYILGGYFLQLTLRILAGMAGVALFIYWLKRRALRAEAGERREAAAGPAVGAALTAVAVFMALYLYMGFGVLRYSGWEPLIWPYVFARPLLPFEKLSFRRPLLALAALAGVALYVYWLRRRALRAGAAGRERQEARRAARAKANWRRVDQPGDFEKLAVWFADEPHGPVFRISFWHREWPSELRKIVPYPAVALAIVLVFVTAGKMSSPGWWYVCLAAIAAGVIAVCYWSENAVKVSCDVELNVGANLFRIRKRTIFGSDIEIERPLDRLAGLTIDEHPDAELARAIAQERREKGLSSQGLSNAEKSHCLFGFFGARGAVKVLLLTRAEWPTQHSLFEVQQAIEWVKELANREDFNGDADTGPRPGMNPPLE